MKNETSFIPQLRSAPWFTPLLDHYAIELVVCDYQLDAYQDSLFAELETEFHPSLKRAVDKRKAEFLAGRVCAVTALEKLGLENQTIGIGEQRQPIWPQGLTGSISHSQQQACAIAASLDNVKGLGIDIQSPIDEDVVEDIHDRIINEQELLFLKGKGLTRQQAVTLTFSAKESFFKGTFSAVGEYFGFESLEVVELDSKEQILECRLTNTLAKALQQDARFRCHYQLLPNQSYVSLFIWN